MVIGDGVKAHSVTVSVDGGALTVAGTIDASGAAPGTIRLSAGNGLALASTAVLDAHGTVLQTVELPSWDPTHGNYAIFGEVIGVHVDPAILAWVSRLSEESRRNVNVRLGISVRGCLALVRCARTWALSQGRNHVVPDDIKALAQPVLGHRVLLTAEAEFAGTTVERVVDQIFAEVAPPAERR